MNARVLTGTKQEIVERMTEINGEIREAIVFVEEDGPSTTVAPDTPSSDIFAEMEPYSVRTDHIDDSRNAIYQRAEGEFIAIDPATV